MTIHTFSYQEKQKLIAHLARLYTNQYIVLHYHAQNLMYETCAQYDGATTFVNFIEGVLELLTKEHKQILVNDFFRQKDRDWWTQYYSKTTYYRIKAIAMNEFLHCL